jgi:hypothetical protein
MYVAHVEGDMCHVDINMVTWQHQRLPRVTHFWYFRVNPWTNEKAPRGSPYNQVANRTVTWQADVASDMAGG